MKKGNDSSIAGLKFKGKEYGKGRAVLAIVQDYVESHPNVTYKELKQVFPDELHSRGIVQPLSTAKAKAKEDRNRYYVNDAIKLSDKVIAVCSDFGSNNIRKFLDHVTSTLGYKVKVMA